MPRRLLSPPPPAPAASATASAGPAASACSCRTCSLVLHLLGVEAVLQHRDEGVLGQLLVLVLLRLGALAERERETKAVARHLVERVADDGDVLRLLSLAAVEVRARRELECQRLV